MPSHFTVFHRRGCLGTGIIMRGQLCVGIFMRQRQTSNKKIPPPKKKSFSNDIFYKKLDFFFMVFFSSKKSCFPLHLCKVFLSYAGRMQSPASGLKIQRRTSTSCLCKCVILAHAASRVRVTFHGCF